MKPWLANELMRAQVVMIAAFGVAGLVASARHSS
jgi:hypothetical protein